MAWLLVVWACLLPALAAAHDLEHSLEEHDEHAPVLCACAALADRDDDAPLGSQASLLLPSERLRNIVDVFADDLAGFDAHAHEAIRAPPAG
ncbi:MAG: hypothetical protein AAGI89_08450 [Pseudomonadota bacterium]